MKNSYFRVVWYCDTEGCRCLDRKGVVKHKAPSRKTARTWIAQNPEPAGYRCQIEKIERHSIRY